MIGQELQRHRINDGRDQPISVRHRDHGQARFGLDFVHQFLDPDAFNEIKVETEGKFGGLGIEITIKDGVLTVVAPIDDTPAARAGIRPGDRIVRIGSESTVNMTLNEAVNRLRGEPGTKAVIYAKHFTLLGVAIAFLILAAQNVRLLIPGMSPLAALLVCVDVLGS
mgnify:CR=1 FL=1